MDAAGLMKKLDAMGGRGALVGPKGTGKTTLMLELAQHPTLDVRYIRLNEAQSNYNPAHLENLNADSMILLDGAEQLNPVRWWFFRWRVRKTGRLLISTHRPGRLPVVLKTAGSAELLLQLLGELIENIPTRSECATLLKQHNGNIRLVFHHLYRTGANRNMACSSQRREARRETCFRPD